jgi:hypothetical protein
MLRGITAVPRARLRVGYSENMKNRKIAGAVLLLLGLLALVYGGFSYTKDTDRVDIGPIHVETKQKERVNIPVWAGAASVIAGGILLAL